MFDVGMQEIIIIFIVALIALGPKRLPDIARALGRALAEFRRAMDDLKKDLDINGVKEAKEKLLHELVKSPPPQDATVKETRDPPPPVDREAEKKE